MGGFLWFDLGLKREDLVLRAAMDTFDEEDIVLEVRTEEEETESESPGIAVEKHGGRNLDFWLTGVCFPLQLGPKQVPP